MKRARFAIAIAAILGVMLAARTGEAGVGDASCSTLVLSVCPVDRKVNNSNAKASRRAPQTRLLRASQL